MSDKVIVPVWYCTWYRTSIQEWHRANHTRYLVHWRRNPRGFNNYQFASTDNQTTAPAVEPITVIDYLKPREFTRRVPSRYQ